MIRRIILLLVPLLLLCGRIVIQSIDPVTLAYQHNFNMAEEPSVKHTSSSRVPMDSPDYSWAMFRHDPRHTGCSAGPAPDSPNVLWKNNTDRSLSYPVAENDIVFFTYDDPRSFHYRIWALNATTGEELWLSRSFRWSGSSPAVAGDEIYTTSDTMILAFDKYTGVNVQNITLNARASSHLVISDNMIFLGVHRPYLNPSHIFAINKDNGNVLWNYTFEPIGSVEDIAVSEDKVFATYHQSASEDYVYCLGKHTGNFNWRLGIEICWSMGKHLTISDEVVYLAYENSKRGIAAVDANSGSILWKRDVGSGLYLSTPTLAYGRLYFTYRDAQLYIPGLIYSLDTNGTRIWSKNVYSPGYVSVLGAPIIADGKIYASFKAYQSPDCYIVALDAYSGDSIWSYKIPQLALPGYFGLAIAEGKLFVAGGNAAHVFGEPARAQPKMVSVTLDKMEIDYGDWVSMTVVARNDGGKADEMYISVSLPDNPSISNIQIVSHDLHDAYILPIGSEVWGDYGTTYPIVLKYPLVEARARALLE